MNEGDPDIPSWMRAVDESTLYNASSGSSRDDEDYSTCEMRFAERSGRSADREPREPRDDDASSVQRKLSALMEPPDASPRPDRQPKMLGYVSPEVENQLRRALAVLRTRYTDGPSRSLVLAFAVHTMLDDLWDEGEESTLITWLDTVLQKA